MNLHEKLSLRIKLAYGLLLQLPILLILWMLVVKTGLWWMDLLLFCAFPAFSVVVGVRYFLKNNLLSTLISILLFCFAWNTVLITLCAPSHLPVIVVQSLIYLLLAIIALLYLLHFLEVGTTRRLGMLFVFLLVFHAICMCFYAFLAPRSGTPKLGLFWLKGTGIGWGFLILGSVVSALTFKWLSKHSQKSTE